MLNQRVNFPLLPGETIRTATEHVRAIIADRRVQIKPVTSDEGILDPPITCGPNPSSFEVLSQTTREVMPDAFVAPSMVTRATNGHLFANAALSANWYRTVPIKIRIEEVVGMYGANERALITGYVESVNFYIN